MSDRISPEHRSWNMSRIRGSDTAIEVAVRKYLFSKGFRYRKNDKRLPGKPDIVLPKYRTIIFVNGCFWHFHKNCPQARLPKTNTEFWKKKLTRNSENDKKNIQRLRRDEWRVTTLWECELEKDFEKTMKRTINYILKER